MRARRLERELCALLRAPEEGARNVEAFLAAHGAELGLDTAEMAGPDEELAPRLRAIFEQKKATEQHVAQAGIVATVRELRRDAYWRNGRLVVPPFPFFRLASLRARATHLRFVGSGIDIAVRRQLLRRTGTALRAFRDVSVFLDADGAHVRWGERGGLNFYPQDNERLDALVVSLPPRAVPPRMPVLLGEILAELGFGI